MLTPKQEVFVQGIIKGLSQADAYREAYNTQRMSDKTIHEAASRLMADSKVSARVQELREQVDKETIMSAQKRKEWLTGIINDPEIDINARLKASDQLNRMDGEYIQKVETTVTNAVNINIELVDD